MFSRMGPIQIATRGSALALAQARMVQAACERAFPGERFELRIIKTTGDRLQTASLRKPPPDLPKGLFTKELEVALLDGKADLAVHSLKDLPSELPPNLRLGAVLVRADVRDVLVTRGEPGRPRGFRQIGQLPAGAVVATSSTRRAAQLRALRSDLRVVEIRGNVPTRLKKLASGNDMTATLLAAAGLARLGISIDKNGRLTPPPDLAPDGWGCELYAAPLGIEEMLPAPGQAAIGIECRRRDPRIARICRALNDSVTRICVEAERAFLAQFGGGCASPVAALGALEGGQLRLEALAFEGDRVWRESGRGPASSPRQLGRSLGRKARRHLLGPVGA